MSEYIRDRFPKIAMMASRGYTARQIADQVGLERSTIYGVVSRNDLRVRPEPQTDVVPARCLMDNAVTTAFRVVMGYCPIRDGVEPGTGVYASKRGKLRATDVDQTEFVIPPKRAVRIEEHWTFRDEFA
jgi:hypothetical protein